MNLEEQVLEMAKGLVDEEKKARFFKSTNLFEEAIFDSFGLIQLVNEIEKNYDISIKTDDLNIQNFANVEQIAVLIKNYKN